MEANMVPKWLQNGAKVAPIWLPGGLWAAFGPDPVARRSPEPSRRGSGTAWGVPKNSSWRPWNTLGAKSGSIAASWRVPGSHLGSFLAVAPAGTTKKQKSHKTVCFFGAVFACVFLTLPCVFCSPRHSPARKHNLKICFKPLGFYDDICVCAVCARSANILQTERTSNKKLSKCKRKTPCHGSSKKNIKKHRFGSQCLQKSTPEASGSALAASCARLLRQELSKSSLGGLQGRSKKLENFQRRP